MERLLLLLQMLGCIALCVLRINCEVISSHVKSPRQRHAHQSDSGDTAASNGVGPGRVEALREGINDRTSEVDLLIQDLMSGGQVEQERLKRLAGHDHKRRKRSTRLAREAAKDEDDDDHHHSNHHHDKSHSWKYYGLYGPSNWTAVASECGGQRQTPIDIRTSQTKVDETMGDLTLLVTEPHPGQGVTITNNGHSVNVMFDNVMRVSGGKLGGTFRVAGLHFHWGVTDSTGSEHAIDGNRYPLEMHIVTYDEDRYDGVGEALKGKNSLAVLGVMFAVSNEDNPAIEPIVSHLMSVQFPGHSARVPYFDLRTLLPIKYNTRFYRYLGSLTTPPCSEVVVWTLFEHVLTISSGQLSYFRQLYEGQNARGDYEFLKYNWRPIQPLNGRTVVRSFLHHSHGKKTDLVAATPAPQEPPKKVPQETSGGEKCNCPTHSSAPSVNRQTTFTTRFAAILILSYRLLTRFTS